MSQLYLQAFTVIEVFQFHEYNTISVDLLRSQSLL